MRSKSVRIARRGGAAAIGALCLLATGLTGCISSPAEPSIPPPVNTPTQARITVTCGSYTVAASSQRGFQHRITFPCTLTESAGLGANINFVRLRLTRAGAEVEVQAIGSGDIIAGTGTNRLNANQTRSANVAFDFNRGDATGGTLDFNFGDDRGNTLSVLFNFSS